MNAIPRDIGGPGAGSWRRFLDLSGGSFLYCLSALTLIYAITKILGPLLAESATLRDTLPCLGTLNLYELALLGTLAFIVVFRYVTDDAISLVLLIPLFLIGGGIALDTVAGKDPAVAMVIGAFCAAIGLGKLHILQRATRMPVAFPALAGFALATLWNFLSGPALAMLRESQVVPPEMKRTLWLINLLVILAAGGLVLAGIVRAGARPTREPGNSPPFLRTIPMTGLFAGVLFAAAGAHLYATGYILTARFTGGDFLLLISLGALLLAEMLLDPGNPRPKAAAWAAGAPLGVTLWGLTSRSFFGAPFECSLELLGHPAFILAVTGAAVAGMAIRTRRSGFHLIAGAYAITAVWTADLSAWRYVILSFLLLAAGARLSSSKGRRSEPIPDQAPNPA